jgi:hypothetical protein
MYPAVSATLTGALCSRPLPRTPDPADAEASTKATQTFIGLIASRSLPAVSRLVSPQLGARLAAALRTTACPSPTLRRTAAQMAAWIDTVLDDAAGAGCPGAGAGGGGGGEGGASPAACVEFLRDHESRRTTTSGGGA